MFAELELIWFCGLKSVKKSANIWVYRLSVFSFIRRQIPLSSVLRTSLEISLRASAHGFESHPLRQKKCRSKNCGVFLLQRIRRDSKRTGVNFVPMAQKSREPAFPQKRNPILSAKKITT